MRIVEEKPSAFTPHIYVTPDKERMLHEETARCGHCMRRFPAADLTMQDGVLVCRQALSPRTTMEYRAMIEESIAAKTEMYALKPNVSQARMPWQAVATIVTMTDASGNRIAPNSPLSMVRTVAATLTLTGIHFSASDTFAYPSGISDSVAPSRAGSSTWTLTLVASGGMTPGDKYDLTFNGGTLRNVFRVR